MRNVVALAALFSVLAATDSAVAQPTISKVFTPDTIGPGSVSTITFAITNDSGLPVTGLQFTDSLPAAITIADPAKAATTCDLSAGGLLSAPDGGSTITLMNAQVGPFESCAVNVDVTAKNEGVHTNPAITLNSSAGSSMSLAADLTVATDRAGFSKSFSPSSVPLGGRSTLTFTIDNSLNVIGATSIAFTDTLPAGMEVADPTTTSSDCDEIASTPVITAVPGSNLVSFSSGSLEAERKCTFSVQVIATSAGMLDNVSGELTASYDGPTRSSGKASATLLSSTTPISLIKTFTNDPVAPGGMAALEFTIINLNRSLSATDVAFTDDLTTVLPGLTFDSLVSEDCLGSVSGVGGTTIGLSGGILSPDGSCTIKVNLSVPPGATAGSYTNTTSTVSGTVDGSPVVGNMASDELFVEPIPIFTKEFIDDPTTGGSTVTLRFTITNTDPTSVLTGIEFTDDIGGSGSGRTASLPGLAANGLLAMGGLEPEPLVDPCGAGSKLTIPDASPAAPGFPDPPPDPTMLIFTGGSLAPAGMMGDSCTFDVVLDVPNGTQSGTYPNMTSSLTATPSGGGAAKDDLIIVGAPMLTKEFTDDPVPPGDTVTLSFTLSQAAEAPGDATGISFTDDLNALGIAGLTVNLPPSPDPPCGTGSSLTAPGKVLTLTNGTLMPGQNCTFSVTLDIPALATPGTFTNTTSAVEATVQGLEVSSQAASDILKISGLTFTKEFTDDPVIAGDTVTLRFTIANTHPTDDATGIFFTDDLAAVLPGASDLTALLPPNSDTCGGMMTGPTFLTYTGGSLSAGMTCTIELDVLVPAGTSNNSYLNVTGNLSATQGVGVTIDPATDNLVVDSNRLQLTKSFTDDPVAPGNPVTLEFVLSNLDATRTASAITFTDDLSAALTGLTFDNVVMAGTTCVGTFSGTGTEMIGVSSVSLAAGASCTLRVSLSVPALTAAGSYTNTTSGVTGTMNTLPVTGPAASDDLGVIQILDFSKSFDGPTAATGTAILTFTITNPGTGTASNIAFSDNLQDVISGLNATSLPVLPCGAGSSITGISLLTFTGGELPPMGGTCSFDVEVLVPSTATAGTFTNTTSNLFQNGLKVANPATADLVIEPPPVFQKHFSPSPMIAGVLSTLVFYIDNTASQIQASNLTFTDNLPAGVVVAADPGISTSCGGTVTAMAGAGTISFSGGTVGAGSDCDVQVNVTSSVAGSHLNTSGALTSSSGNSGTASATLIVLPAVDLSVTKTDGVTSATPGGSVTYEIVATNNGPSSDPNVSLTDTFPSPPLTCTYTSLAAGGAAGNTLVGAGDLSETLSMPAGSSVTYMVTCVIDSDASGTLSNTATINASVFELAAGNDSATDDDTVLSPEADLSLVKDDGGASVVPGTNITYTLTVTNNGPSDSSGGSVSDTLPSGLSFVSSTDGCTESAGVVTCPVPALANGAGVDVTFVVIVDAGQTAAITNSATVTGNEPDPNEGNNTATDGTPLLGAEADLGLGKDDGVIGVLPGGTLTYTLTVTNNGPSDSTGGSISDALPAGLTFVSSASGCSQSAGVVSCPVPAIVVGDSTDLTFVVAVDAGQLSEFTNSATVTGYETDPDDGDNEASHVTRLVPGFSKSFSPNPISEGGVSTLTFTIDNTANTVAATDLAFNDNLPAGMTVASPNNAANTCGGTLTANEGTGSITLNGGMAAAGGTCTIDVDVTSSSIGESENTTDSLTSSLGTSSTATDTLSVVDGVLILNKAFVGTENLGPAAIEDGSRAQPLQGMPPLMPGDLVDLEYTITNTSTIFPLTEIAFTDDLDAVIPGLVAVGLPIADQCGMGSNTSGTSVITFANGSLPPSSSCTFRVTLRIPSDALPGTYASMTSAATALASGAPVMTPAAVAELTIVATNRIPFLSDLGLILMAGMLVVLACRRILML